MTLDTFFSVASPTTLASLIADITALESCAAAEFHHKRLRAVAQDTLESIVGRDEAKNLIAAAESTA